jgi:RNA polymerase sigma factor (sigma-70 family)
METTEAVGKSLKPAFTWEELAEVSRAEALRHHNRLKNLFRTEEQISGIMEELASEFVRGACEAKERAEEGKAIRSYQWSYGKGRIADYLKKVSATIFSNDKSLSDAVSFNDDGEAESTLADKMEQTREVNPAEAVCESDAGPSAIDTLTELDERTAQIIRRHHIDGLTLQAIADELGLSLGRIHQIEAEGLDQMRRKLQAA